MCTTATSWCVEICVDTYVKWDVQATWTHDHTVHYSQVVPRDKIRIPKSLWSQDLAPYTSQSIN